MAKTDLISEIGDAIASAIVNIPISYDITFDSYFEIFSKQFQGVTIDSSNGNLIAYSYTDNSFYIYSGISSTVIDSFSHSGSNCLDICYDSSTGNLIASDSNNTIYVYSGLTSTVSSSFSAPEFSGVAGITIDSQTGNLISSNSESDTIYVHSGISDTILSSFDAPSGGILGMDFDSNNNNLLVADITSDSIIILDGISNTIVEYFNIPELTGYSFDTNAFGIAFDATNKKVVCCERTNGRFNIFDYILNDNFFTWNSHSVNPKNDNIEYIKDEAGSLQGAYPICLVHYDDELGVAPTSDTGRNGGLQLNDITFKVAFFPYVNDELSGITDPIYHHKEINKCIRDLKKALFYDKTLGGKACNLFYNGTERMIFKENSFGKYCGIMDITVRYRQRISDIDVLGWYEKR